MNFVRSIISFVSAIFSFYKNLLLQPHLKFFRILCLGLFLLPTTSKGQKIIYMYDFKPAILEQEIKKGIDSVRIAHKLSPLVNDSICRWAAYDQAIYLKKKRVLTHDQRKLKKKTPSKRVKYYGGSANGIGENVAQIPIYTPTVLGKGKNQIPYYGKTYQQAAKMFVTAWVNSPGHFKNIITPAYTHTGIGVWLDLKRYTIYAAQAFSISQQGSATTRATPYSPQSLQKRQRKRGIDYKEDHNYKLTYNDSACANCSFNWRGSKVTSEKGGVYLSTFYGSEELIKHLRNKGNGFATETVNYSSFSTNNNDWHLMPSRRNQQQIKNGRLTLPYYRKSIIRQIMRQAPFKTNRKLANLLRKGEPLPGKIFPMFLKVKIGEIPEQFKIGVTETNLVVISNKNICSVVHGSGYCGEDYLTIKKLPYQAVFDYGDVAIEPQVDSIAVQIPFERKSAALDEKKFYTDLKKEGLTVQPWLDIVSSVHASVEGTDSVNNRLLKERSIVISRFVAKYFSQSKHVLDSSLAWDNFYKVVRNDEQYNVWASYDKKTISNLLNTKVFSTRMDSILWQTRKTELIFRFYSTKVDTVKAYLSYFTKALHELRTTREISKEEAARLNRIFSHLYRYALKGKVKWQTLSNFYIPSHPDLLTLLNNQNYVMLTHDSSYTSNSRIHQLYQRLVAAGNVTEPHHSAAATYNLINFSIEHRDSGIKVIGLERMVELFNLLGDPNNLGRNLHFLRSSKYFSHHKDWVKRDASLQQLFYYLKAETLSEEEAMKISGKYLAASASTLAAKILEPFALKANPSHPMLIEYLKAAYVHKETLQFECYTDPTYVNNLLNASTILTNREWCSMFVGDCNISFQVFDYPEVREKYCEICNERDDVILKGQAK